MQQLCIGVELNFELKQSLNASIEWRHAQLQGDEGIPHSILWNKREYLGRSLPHSQLSLCRLLEEIEEVRQQIATFAPEIDPSTLRFEIFPQTLITSSTDQP